MRHGRSVSREPLARHVGSAGRLAALALVLACGGSPRSEMPADSSAGTASSTSAGAMDGMFHGLMGGCAVLASESGSPSVEIVIDESAASSPARISIQVDSATSRELTAELSGSDTRVQCGGVAPMIRFGGPNMMIGTPTLRVVTSGPVAVSVRTSTARTVAGPVTVEPGKAAPPLSWGQ